MSKRFMVVLADAAHDRLERLALAEGRKTASQAAFMLEAELEQLERANRIPKKSAENQQTSDKD